MIVRSKISLKTFAATLCQDSSCESCSQCH